MQKYREDYKKTKGKPMQKIGKIQEDKLSKNRQYANRIELNKMATETGKLQRQLKYHWEK